MKDRAVDALVAVLPQCGTLERLSLSGCGICDRGAQAIAHILP
ncbi:hypothetical protein KIPB_016469, partial [Kipferlia bialata]|eukprot:g16469.t1